MHLMEHYILLMALLKPENSSCYELIAVSRRISRLGGGMYRRRNDVAIFVNMYCARMLLHDLGADVLLTYHRQGTCACEDVS